MHITTRIRHKWQANTQKQDTNDTNKTHMKSEAQNVRRQSYHVEKPITCHKQDKTEMRHKTLQETKQKNTDKISKTQKKNEAQS